MEQRTLDALRAKDNQIDPVAFEDFIKKWQGVRTPDQINWRGLSSQIDNLVNEFQQLSLQAASVATKQGRSGSGDFDPSDSGSHKSAGESVKSETHKMAPDTPNKLKLLNKQTISSIALFIEALRLEIK